MTDDDRKQFETLLEGCGISGKYASRVPALDGLVALLSAHALVPHLLSLLIIEAVIHDIVKFAPGHHECRLCFGSGGTVEDIGSPYVPCHKCKPNSEFGATVFYTG